MSTVLEHLNRKQWLAARRTGIGGSDIAKVAGLSKYGGPLDVYLDKLGLVEEQPDNWHMRRGRALEPEILSVYSERTGNELEVLQPFTLFRDGIFIGSPDGLVVGGELGVEAKAPDFYGQGEFGEPGSDEVPEPYLVQCQWYMNLTGRQAWDLAATIGADVEVFHLQRSDELIAALRDMAERFWVDHVLAGVPPRADGSESSRAWLAKQFPKATRPLLDPTPEALELFHDYPFLLEARDNAEAEYAELQNKARQLTGDAEGFTGLWTYRNNKDSVKVDYAAVVEELRLHFSLKPEDTSLQSIPRTELLGLLDTLVAEATTIVPGPRVLRFNRKKSAKGGK